MSLKAIQTQWTVLTKELESESPPRKDAIAKAGAVEKSLEQLAKEFEAADKHCKFLAFSMPHIIKTSGRVKTAVAGARKALSPVSPDEADAVDTEIEEVIKLATKLKSAIGKYTASRR